MEKLLKVVNSKKFIKTLSGTMAAILAVSTVAAVWKNSTLKVEANGDTLPGIAQLRDDLLKSGEPYKILELVPDVNGASLGFYIGGEEPFNKIWDEETQSIVSLYNEETNTFDSWRDKLQELEEQEERQAFVAEISDAAEKYLETFHGDGEAPYFLEDYKEFDAPNEDTYTLSYGEVIRRGYLEYVDDHGNYEADWWAVFKRGEYAIEDVDEIKNSMDTLYYMESSSQLLDYAQIEEWAKNEETANIPIYVETNDRADTYFTYSGTAKEVWADILESVSGNMVPGGSASGGSASGGSASGGSVSGDPAGPPSTDTTITPGDISGNDIYYEVQFKLINDGNPDNDKFDYGVPVYLIEFAEDNSRTHYVDYGGNYRLVETKENEMTGAYFTEPEKNVYYTGGIISREVFKHQVLSINKKADLRSLNVEVYVMTPAMLNEKLEPDNSPNFLNDFDMIYISGGAKTDFNYGNEGQVEYVEYNPTYTAEDQNDLSETSVRILTDLIQTQKKPCLFDLSDFCYIENGYYEVSENVWDEELDGFYQLVCNLMDKSEGTEYGDFEKYDTDLDMQFVKGSVWFFNGNYTSEKYMDGDEPHRFVRNDMLADTKYTEGTGETRTIVQDLAPVYDEIVLENKYRDTDSAYTGGKGGKLSLDVYDWTIWRYIINYVNNKTNIQKNVVNVLEIQPASRDNVLTELEVLQWLGYMDHDIDTDGDGDKDIAITVNIETIAMNEFVGVITDMNASYDMIYIGSSTAGLNVDDNGETVYNNGVAMNGLLYSNVGDTVEVMPNFSGLLKTDFANNDWNSDFVKASTTHRYSGNDLTVEKYNVLLDYLDATYPIVVDEVLMEAGEQEGSWKANAKHVDNSSYLYEFINNAFTGTKYKSIFCETDLKRKTEENQTVAGEKSVEFEFYVNRPKLSLEASGDYPDLIRTNTHYQIEGEAENRRVTQINRQGGINGRYYLEYEFTIRNSGSVVYDEDYVCKLYLDSNADGKFSEVNEELTGLSITDASGNSVAPDELKLGVRYIVRREVPENYYGCITWQLSVAQKKNQSIRTTHKGYTKLNTGEQFGTEIKILQIYFEATEYTDTVKIDENLSDEGFAAELARDRVDPKVINLETSIGEFNYESGYYELDAAPTSAYFQGPAQAISGDYILNIDAISSTRFELNSEKYDLDNYDMLILGFSDAKAWADFKNETVIGPTDPNAEDNSIQAFIASGKSVLFAHDMTSFINIEVDYDSTKDRHNQPYKRIEGSTTYNDEDFFLYKPDGSHVDTYWGFQMNKYLRSMVGLDTYGITVGNLYENNSYVNLKEGAPIRRVDGVLSIPEPTLKSDGTYRYDVYDVGYLPGSGRAETVPQVQGFTAYSLNQRMYNANAYGYRAGMPRKNNGGSPSTRIEKVNDGQITNFPFVIDDVFTTEDTHHQYYTLDLNADSDADMMTDTVVWYNLAGGHFDYAPGDVKNNYYIYNKGNITYTGMGHSAENGNANGHVEEMEAKLFINTMVAAYNTGIRSPEIKTYNANGVETDSIFSYYDDLFTQGTPANSTVDMRFEVEDLNMTHGSKNIEAQFFVEDRNLANSDAVPEGVNIENGVKVKNVSSDLALYDEKGDLLANPIRRDAAGRPLGTLEFDDSGNVKAQYVIENGVRTEVLNLKNGIVYRVGDAAGGYKALGVTGLQPGVVYQVKIPTSYFARNINGYDSQFYIAAQTTMTRKTTGDEVVVNTAWGYGSLNYANIELFNLD